MFVDPEPGPVLANTGLNQLTFSKPVTPDTDITVALTVKRKTKRTDEYGEVRWHVEIRDAENDLVASYELLTMVAI
jgi:oxepin-CoA hydrolase/3-oxo-5,6-dehydrosuberyl-CoA semialdehyde dehydrogenase